MVKFPETMSIRVKGTHQETISTDDFEGEKFWRIREKLSNVYWGGGQEDG